METGRERLVLLVLAAHSCVMAMNIKALSGQDCFPSGFTGHQTLLISKLADKFFLSAMFAVVSTALTAD